MYLALHGPYEIRHNDVVLQIGDGLPKTRVQAGSAETPSLQIGDLVYEADQLEIVPRQSGTLEIFFETSTGKWMSHRYEGSAVLHAHAPVARASGSSSGNSPATVDLVNVVKLEHYLAAVLEAELYPNWHIETYRAQAIASRTYVLFVMRTFGTRRAYDVHATETSQAYRGIDSFAPGAKSMQAVRDTRGVVCTWPSPLGDKIFCTYFSAACGGKTENVADWFELPSIPPLAGGVRCDYCQIDNGKQVYRWGPVLISKKEIYDTLRSRDANVAALGGLQTIRVGSVSRHGRPRILTLVGTNGQTLDVVAYDFRLALGGYRLKSTDFVLVDRGDSMIFSEGKGFGHGVGLCQWGAEGQARLGRRASGILSYYYPGSSLRRAYE